VPAEYSPTEEPKKNHLSADEVIRLLEFVSKCRPIVVGGQSINIWANLLEGQDPELDALGPLTSEDVDFYHNKEAERALAAGLENGKIEIPTADDFTPNAAVVTGRLGDRDVVVDFMSAVKGVSDASLMKQSITFADIENPDAVSITLMHPLDCVRSRLANINTLKRTSEHSIRQAIASVKILECYVDDELSRGDSGGHRRATRCLQELEYILIGRHIGQISHTEYGDQLDILGILLRRQGDDRIDSRWREKILEGILARVTRKLEVQSTRAALIQS
jgi:hypothetical protein